MVAPAFPSPVPTVQEYNALFTKWQGKPWIAALNAEHAKVEAVLANATVSIHQPNPWADEGIEVTSKKYLIRILEACVSPLPPLWCAREGQ